MVQVNIVRNFVAHLTSFHQAGAIKQVTVYKCLLILEQMTEKSQQCSQFCVSWSVPAASSLMNSSNASSSSNSSTTSSPSVGETEPRASVPSPTSVSTPPSRSMSSSILSKISPHSRGMQMVNLATKKHDLAMSPGGSDPKKPRLSLTSSSPTSLP